ncbi:hypothetical protein HDU76_003945 [Blyttiomyces sp. JEL0837]|nr:hypothetical protein HDU76_003945 [Blyttiomyces sp. JEL0837]
MRNWKFFEGFLPLPRLPRKAKSVLEDTVKVLSLGCIRDSKTTSTLAIDTFTTLLANVFQYASFRTQLNITTLTKNFSEILATVRILGSKTMEDQRDEWYRFLNHISPNEFPLKSQENIDAVRMMEVIIGYCCGEWGFEVCFCTNGCPQVQTAVGFKSASVIHVDEFICAGMLNTPSTIMRGFQQNKLAGHGNGGGYKYSECDEIVSTAVRIPHERTPFVFMRVSKGIKGFKLEDELNVITADQGGVFYCKKMRLAVVVCCRENRYFGFIQVEGFWYEYDALVAVDGQAGLVGDFSQVESRAKLGGGEICGLSFIFAGFVVSAN